MKKLTTDDPLYLENYKAKEKFRPFTDIPDSQLFLLLDSLPADHPKKILFYNFNDIFMDVFEQFPEFGMMGYGSQKEAVQKIIDRYKESDDVVIVSESQQNYFGG